MDLTRIAKISDCTQELAVELHKPVIKTFKNWKVYSPFIDNIWAADVVDVQLKSTFNKWIHFLLCVIDIFSKYAWIIPLKDKKVLQILILFKKS